MGGKSNRFDFTNRANSGVNLGNSIGSALVKEAEKLQRTAEKAERRGRKESTGSTLSFDPKDHGHAIDLQAPGKELGIDGVAAMSAGLGAALSKCTASTWLALESLSLPGNGLTAAAMPHLASMAQLSCRDLRILNLSNNQISITSDQDAAQWESLLIALSRCSRLCRLDLSRNEVGSRALEIFSRVYHAASPGCTLRSTASITLQDVGLGDAGALWLSYMLESHYSSDEESGFDWSANDKSLGKDGILLLQRTASKEISDHGIDSIRKRVQRHIIELDGVGSVELWAAALKLVNLARAMYILCECRESRTKKHKSGAQNGFRVQTRSGSDPALLTSLIAPHVARVHLLSEGQKTQAIRWGLCRASIQTALEWRKRDEASEIWLLLDKIECLSYA
ncbi:hypothetical protein K470DRAFT_270486 [Piedraia hortae CBS 480.64]|uniref:RNI-like protein n=1 Tax=Piedraia hortae CBS 480.64 TaxID=1314780 RepID=A0A6A7C0V8_9PEZI|nr:hypothetical protein K470DRAFT_270486 [Piedraia hortae CBS 480.64]